VRLIAKEDRKPFAFVQFETEDIQTAAVTENRNITINGGECVVRFARPKGASRFRRFPRRSPAGPQRAAVARAPPANPPAGDRAPAGGARRAPPRRRPRSGRAPTGTAAPATS
jgi:RNA recognition motif-containing protein